MKKKLLKRIIAVSLAVTMTAYHCDKRKCERRSEALSV